MELSPPEGAIGVVGSNGTGKSTLFESLLWAFFGSRGGGPRFSNELLPWSGGSTKDPTIVEVGLALGGQTYTVRRQLKSNQTTAEARDPEGRVIVTGAAEVARWAEAHLLGMDRTAFEATFYARQKELKFFAQDDGISRVRRISGMLGISHVEDAQKLLRADRNELRSEARHIESRLAEADADALTTELDEARAECRRLEGELEKVSTDHEAAREELEGARKARAALEATYRKHTELATARGEAESQRARAADRAAEAGKDLEELAANEEELGRLKPQASRLPELGRELESLEESRRLVESRERLRQERRDGQRRIADIEAELGRTLEELDGEAGEEPLPGWNELFDLDGPQLLEKTLEVLDGAGAGLEAAEARVGELEELRAEHLALERAQSAEEEARGRHETAQEEARRLSEAADEEAGGEDLEVRQEELRREEEKLRELAASRRGTASATEREAKNVDKARSAIESGADDHCPTCHRSFEAGEQDDILETLGRQEAAIRRRAAREKEEARQHSESADATSERLEKVSARLGRWRELREALARAETGVASRGEALEEARGHWREIEARLAGAPVPAEEDLGEARSRRDALRGLRDARPGAASLAREHSGLRERLGEVGRELEGLAEVSYDPEAHRERREEKARLERVLGRVEELEKRLEGRPEVERALSEAREKEKESAARAESLGREVSALGFDEGEFEAAGERVRAAEEKSAGLRDERERLGGEWKDADHRIERVSGELQRLETDRRKANEKAAGAARMDEMDGLFTEFFRSLTSRVRPVLEGEASALIRELTDGRYERMEFDENYRVRLLDRFDDSYAIDRFSGGEADVASLSARVALSKLIASRGSETLGFLVLDEVFGSLDAERRANVLLALERLKRAFGQIFIISHVGEVQESALMDEVWMLEEDEDGKSTVRSLETAAPDLRDVYEAGATP